MRQDSLLHTKRSRIMGHHASKLLKVFLFGSVVGIFDGVQAKFLNFGSFGNEVAIFYQACYMATAIIGAGVILYDNQWSLLRNATNYLMAIPIATIGDNVSIDVQTLKPYFLAIPKEGFLWRSDVFGNTKLASVASWVNQQTLAAGIIDGYLVAIALAVVYLCLQHYWLTLTVRDPTYTFYSDTRNQRVNATTKERGPLQLLSSVTSRRRRDKRAVFRVED